DFLGDNLEVGGVIALAGHAEAGLVGLRCGGIAAADGGFELRRCGGGEAKFLSIPGGRHSSIPREASLRCAAAAAFGNSGGNINQFRERRNYSDLGHRRQGPAAASSVTARWFGR